MKKPVILVLGRKARSKTVAALLPGVRCRVVADAAKARQALKRSAPHCVFLNWRGAPWGVEVCRELKAAEASRHIPVVVKVPERMPPKDQTSLLKEWADDLVPEEMDPGVLSARLGVMLRIGRLESELLSNRDKLQKRVRERTREVRRARERAKQLAAINEITHTVNSRLELGDVLRTIVSELRKLVRFDRISVSLLREPGEVLWTFLINGVKLDRLENGLRYVRKGSGAGWVIENRKMLIRRKIGGKGRFYEDARLVEEGIRSVVIAPLIAKGRVIGTFNLSSFQERAYNKRNTRILEQVSGQLAAAVENALLYAEVREFNRSLEEKVRERAEKLQEAYYRLLRLRLIGESMQGTLELDRLLFVILTCATAGGALGFSRAMLLLTNEAEGVLEGRMAVGPMDAEEAGKIWNELSSSGLSLEQLFQGFERNLVRGNRPPQSLIRHVRVPLDRNDHVLLRTISRKGCVKVSPGEADFEPGSPLNALLSGREFLMAPLIARGEVLGVLVADNAFRARPITEESVEMLAMFASQAGQAIHTARAYADLQDKITKLSRAYRQLKETQEELLRAQRMASIGEMAATVAHEIRNPLVTIGGFARSIRKRAPSVPEIGEDARIVAEEVERLERILKNILEYATPGRLALEESSVNALVSGMCEVKKRDFTRERILLRQEYDDALPPIMADRVKIKQVLLNLIKNAEDSMVQGGRLRVRTCRVEDYARIEIIDTGRGIPLEVQKKIFNPFYTTRPEGSGMGLPLSRRIVADHGGRMEVRSREGKGTRIIVDLPLSRTIPPPDRKRRKA